MVSFGEPWPEFNDGIYYRDLLRASDAGATLIEFYSRKYESSAPLHGWLQRIHNKQITIDGCVVTDPNTILRGYERPGKPVPGDCGYHLHAHRLVFPHPVTNEIIKIAAPLPSILLTPEESEAKHAS
ncbi:UNVERIFIED_CONTAM: RNA pseudouridine synthase 5 [Sesamum radiatum]|uniref:RNA pseudouridine synthase 5 n=1 Tax=Sesamum radiatum TaxID=300843 RepID=A0AAW2TII2_SESRA